MALGTITKPSPSQDMAVSNKKWRTRDVQLSSGANYPTGGDTITPLAVGLSRRIEQVIYPGAIRATAAGATARSVAFAHQTDGSVKMQVYTTASAEAANNSDQSAFAGRFTFVGF